MPFQIKYSLGIETIRIEAPGEQHLMAAYRLIREGRVEEVELLNKESRAWCHLVTFDDGEHVRIVATPYQDDADMLYSESENLGIDEIVTICEAFMRSGDVLTSGFAFHHTPWFESDDPEPSVPAVSSAAQAPAVEGLEPEDEDPDLSPQDIVDGWIQSPGRYDEGTVRLAISSGATLGGHGATPVLIRFARCGADPGLIDFVRSLGADIGAVHEGGTALWHAVSTSHYIFADALVLRGADEDEARSSVNLRTWQKRDVKRRITDDIARGDEQAVLAYLANRPARNVGIGLILQAITSERLSILHRLLAAKGELKLTPAALEPVWKAAIGLRDVRYVAALVQYGVHEIVMQPTYSRRYWSRATPETLSFLISNGYIASIDAMFEYLVGSASDRNLALLPVFPDTFFVGLRPEHVVNALVTFSQHAPERIDYLLDHNDFAMLVHYVFGAIGQGLCSVGPLILDGLSAATKPSLSTRRAPAAVWEKYCELRAVAAGLIERDVTTLMPEYARKQHFNYARRRYELLAEAVRHGRLDDESVVHDIATKYINHGYQSLTDAQKHVFDERLAPIFANLAIRPCHWFLDDLPRPLAGQNG